MSDDRAARPLDAARWEEPRGPHLPDVFQRVPALAWVFIAVAAARLWMIVDTASLGPAPPPLLVGGTVTAAVGSLATLLLPAALLIRHPDALRLAPILTVGAVTVAVGEVLEAIEPGFQPFFASASPDSELILVSPIALAYNAVSSLVSLVGLVGIGVGLDRARRRPARAAWRWPAIVLLFAAFLVVSRLAESSRLLPSANDLVSHGAFVVVATGIGIGTILAWAYLTIVAVHGVRAGEEPASGWALGVLAGAFALLAYLPFSVMTVIVAPNVDLNGLLFLASGLFAVARVAAARARSGIAIARTAAGGA
jgi:hypothetical protein